MTLEYRNTDVWKLRLYFALYIGSGGFLFPFLALYYKQIGLTGAQMGLLGSIGWTVSMLLAPLWGRWGDTARNPKFVLQIALVGAAIAYLFIGFQGTFVGIVIFIVLSSIFDNSIGPLSTTHALSATQNEKSGFGSIRLFGSLGWAVAAPLAGWLIEQWGMLVPFAGYAISAILAAVLIQFVSPASSHPEHNTCPPRAPLKQVAGCLAKDRSMLGLAIAMFIVWLTGTGRVQFESIYLVQLGATESIVGLASSIGAFIELPSMLWSDRLVRRHGSGFVLRAALLLQALGMVAIVAVPSVASIFIFRAVQGTSFSLLTVAMVAYIVEGAPYGNGATALTLYDVTLHGLVILIASPLSGIFFDLVGAYWLYAIALAGNLIGWLILSITARPPRVTREAILSS